MSPMKSTVSRAVPSGAELMGKKCSVCLRRVSKRFRCFTEQDIVNPKIRASRALNSTLAAFHPTAALFPTRFSSQRRAGNRSASERQRSSVFIIGRIELFRLPNNVPVKTPLVFVVQRQRHAPEFRLLRHCRFTSSYGFIQIHHGHRNSGNGGPCFFTLAKFHCRCGCLSEGNSSRSQPRDSRSKNVVSGRRSSLMTRLPAIIGWAGGQPTLAFQVGGRWTTLDWSTV